MEAPAVLYHYTSLDTLAMILHNRTIRFSRLDKVDDPQEQRSADSQNLGKMKLVSCWTLLMRRASPCGASMLELNVE